MRFGWVAEISGYEDNGCEQQDLRMILSIDDVLLAVYERGYGSPNSGFQRELQFRVRLGDRGFSPKNETFFS